MSPKKNTTNGAARPKIYKATLAPGGNVVRGPEIGESEAVDERKAGRDVVVCGPSLPDNREQAKKIEHAANGNYKLCPPHASAGPGALPHCQPDPRGPAGHCFYETNQRKAKQTR